MSTVKKTYSQYLAEELGGQEEGDSEGPATKKYRSMVTTDRASFNDLVKQYSSSTFRVSF